MSNYLYVIQCPNSKAIKIGRTSSQNPYERVSGIQTSNPFPLDVCKIVKADGSVESYLHQTFSTYRISGEWFKGECLEAVLTAISIYPEYIKPLPKTKQMLSKSRRLSTNQPVANNPANGVSVEYCYQDLGVTYTEKMGFFVNRKLEEVEHWCSLSGFNVAKFKSFDAASDTLFNSIAIMKEEDLTTKILSVQWH